MWYDQGAGSPVWVPSEALPLVQWHILHHPHSVLPGFLCFPPAIGRVLLSCTLLTITLENQDPTAEIKSEYNPGVSRGAKCWQSHSRSAWSSFPVLWSFSSANPFAVKQIPLDNLTLTWPRVGCFFLIYWAHWAWFHSCALNALLTQEDLMFHKGKCPPEDELVLVSVWFLD